MKFSRKKFFDLYRRLFGALSQREVNGLEFLLGKFESDASWKSIPEISYALATVDHETNHTFQPIMEIRERSNSPRRANQDRYWLTGYQGRGFVQITWKANYVKFGIASTPEKALEPETAYMIMARGMQQGLFRKGHKLSTYISKTKKDYVNAREIINGDVKKNGEKIADRARAFESILLAAAELAEIEPEETKPVEPDKPAEPAKPEDTVTRVPTDPPTIQVQPRDTSIVTKISAGAAAAAPVVAATGLKIGGVEFKTGGLIAIAAVIIVGMIIAAWLWNAAQNRRHDELKLSMINLADRDKLNVVAGSATT